MKKYESFKEWFSDQTAADQKIIRALRKLVKKVAPKLTEEVKWGNGCYIGLEYPVIFLYTDEDHVQFGFFAGASLKDPKKLLQGKGQYVRHVKVYSVKDIQETEFARLIRQAVKIEAE
jgi:hypothetical protein